MSENFSQDQNRKTLRSFYCRDYLWDLFEQMTRELGCSMDYLINEAMREYARSRDYSPSQHAPGQSNVGQNGPGGPPPPDQGQSQQQGNYQTYQHMPSVNQGQQGGSAPQPGPGGPGGPPPPPGPGGPGQGGQGGQQDNWNRDQQPPTKRRSQAPGDFQTQQQNAGRPTLFLVFNNNRYPINSDRFVIGRGSQNTDLTIRDGNISRQHCAILYRNNNWYLKDLGSTNGVEYRGNRIESKRIEEGDVFYLCDYPLQFTYRS